MRILALRRSRLLGSVGSTLLLGAPPLKDLSVKEARLRYNFHGPPGSIG